MKGLPEAGQSTVPNVFDVGMTMLARLVAMIGPFGVSIITARMLGPEDRGRYFFILSLAQIAAQIANLGLHSSNTYLSANRPQIAGRLAVNSLIVALVVAPLVAGIVLLALTVPSALGLRAGSGPDLSSTPLMAILLAPLVLLFLYFSNLAIAIGRVQIFNALTMLSGVMALAAAGLVALAGGDVADYLGGAAAALLVSCVVSAVFVFPGHAGFRFDRDLFREGVLYALRAYLATLFGFLLMRIGVIALEQQASFSELGQFSVASQLTDAMILLPSTVGLLLFPNLMRAAPERRWPAMLRSLRQLGFVMAGLLVLAAIVIPFALPLVFGADFAAAVPLTLALLPTVLLVTLITVISQYLSSEGFPRGQVVAWIAGFLVQAVLAFALAARYGGFGIAIALFLSNSMVLALLGREALRMHRRRAAAGPQDSNGDPSCRP